MTIGIAATGPWAGAGILAGLRSVEAVGRGAIGGFVSLAVLTAEQKLLRAETQTGGTSGLFTGLPPEEILRAPFAALISSGPDRPLPLSQFIAAEPKVGLVTGHRFPHLSTQEGHALNGLVLDAMRRGSSAQNAIDGLIKSHPSFDSGFIALKTNGELGLGNMPSVLRLSHQGATISECSETGAMVATLHNAIQPSKAIAILASEIVLDEIRQRNSRVLHITASAGMELSFGDWPEIHVDDNFQAIRFTHPSAQTLKAETSFGMGDRVKVVQHGILFGWLGQEPFMVVSNGTIMTLDGKPEIQLPVLTDKHHVKDP